MTIPRAELLHECFARSAQQFPDAIAVDVPPSRMRQVRVQRTYAQLDAASRSIASALTDRSIALEEIVIVLLGREDPLLYAAQLGVLHSGGAYCALDPSFPDAHIESVLAECTPSHILTNRAGVERFTALGVSSIALLDVALAATTPATTLPQHPRDPSRLAYVIYTSGTTGKPKGVLLEHRGIVNLVESDRAEFGLRCGDRVAQCSSPAYDSSIEETYLAFAVGATLVPLDDETVRLGPDLTAILRDERLQVFCPPPTLLRALGCVDAARELPDLRLLYVGGEALPQDLVELFAPHCRLENGYGPTECSVTVTRGTMRAGHAVTIGHAVPNNRACIMEELDGVLVEVPAGTRGELCISGAGLARGYRHDVLLTEARFPTVEGIGRLYRTGDLACINAAGEIECFGRIDAQVKLRGYRIELGAVESALQSIAGVQSAAVTVQMRGSEQRLVAFLVPLDADAPPSLDHVRALLRRTLPVYMVPSEFRFLASLPTSIGGKLDRKKLPQLWVDETTTATSIDARDAPQDAVEHAICHAFGVATGKPCGRGADFFHDLDGDSLSAVAAILVLRRDTPAQSGIDFSRVAVRDMYTHRTASALALHLRRATTEASPLRVRRPLASRGNALGASVIRILAMLLGVMLSSGSALLLGVWIEAHSALTMGSAPWLIASISLFILAPIAWMFITLALAVLAKRCLVGNITETAIGYWTWRGTQVWIAASLSRLIPWTLLHGTILEGWAMRCLGAKIGKRVHLSRGVDLPHGAFDLLEIGDDACFAQDSALRALALEDGHLLAGRIRVDARARIGVRAALEPNTIVGEGAEVSALSLVEEGDVVPSGRLWTGVPARDCRAATAIPVACGGRELASGMHAVLALLGRSCGITLVFNLLLIAAVAFGGPLLKESAIFTIHDSMQFSAQLFIVVAVALLLVPTRIVGSALLCRVLPKIRAGPHHRYSMMSLLAAGKAQMLDDACAWLSGSLYWPVWLRVAGARIGRGCEISTIMGTIPEMLTIGEESFFADGIYLAAAESSTHAFEVRATSVGARTFIGNHAVLAQGVAWSDDLFVGVSTAPDPRQARPNTGWLGVPPMQLPRREVVTSAREETHDPSMLRRLNRLFWETLRITVPLIPALVGLLAYLAVLNTRTLGVDWITIAYIVLPASLIASAITLGVLLLFVKWMLLGRVQPGQHAFWSCWCSRWDFLYVVWGYWGRRALAALEGTLVLNAYLRLSGAHIGKRAILGSGFTQLVDPDMLTLGDDATVACQFQAHSFEDRILKIDRLRVGARASVGEQTVVFYGVDIGERAIVRPNGIVMKHDRLAPGSDFCGAPIAPR